MVSRSAVFRVDASLLMGSGHLMRCLTLADALREQGVRCRFICRAHAGNMISIVRERGYVVDELPGTGSHALDSARPQYSAWLGASQETDAQEALNALAGHRPHWLIVDSYGIDAVWERLMAPSCEHLIVIDDLADRQHVCKLLLDQNLGRQPEDYAALLPADATVIAGAQYSLLREDFARLRAYSLARRGTASVNHVLVSMGGVDAENVTGMVLSALAESRPDGDFEITVVMGQHAPHYDDVCELMLTMPWPTRVLRQVSDMAMLMAESDIAIGAAGSTSWERCCLGLPTIMVCTAENQRFVTSQLSLSGAIALLNLDELRLDGPGQMKALFIYLQENSETMSKAAAAVTDGLGCQRVIAAMEAL